MSAALALPVTRTPLLTAMTTSPQTPTAPPTGSLEAHDLFEILKPRKRGLATLGLNKVEKVYKLRFSCWILWRYYWGHWVEVYFVNGGFSTLGGVYYIVHLKSYMWWVFCGLIPALLDWTCLHLTTFSPINKYIYANEFLHFSPRTVSLAVWRQLWNVIPGLHLQKVYLNELFK